MWWGKQWQGNRLQPFPTTCAIERGCLVIVPRDGLEASKKDHHDEAKILPDRCQDDRWHRPLAIIQPPGTVYAYLAQAVVDQAKSRIEHPRPEERHSDPRRNDRKEERCPDAVS